SLASGIAGFLPGHGRAGRAVPGRGPCGRACPSAYRRGRRDSHRHQGGGRTVIRKIRAFLDMIKFEHTIFALPFAYVGAILGAVTEEARLPTWAECGWILLAMVGARSAAMGLNRLIDKAIDARNPRTASRALPAGKLKSAEVVVFVIISLLLLFWAAFQLDPLAVKLLPVAVFMLVFYSYTKRFTWLCHLILGLTIGLAPLGGWVAVSGAVSLPAMVLYLS